jgi:hypothetical protein
MSECASPAGFSCLFTTLFLFVRWRPRMVEASRGYLYINTV